MGSIAKGKSAAISRFVLPGERGERRIRHILAGAVLAMPEAKMAGLNLLRGASNILNQFLPFIRGD
jgi:hypothetical protein